MKAIRGAFLDFLDDPFYRDEREAVRYLPDGLLVIDGERITDFGPYGALAERHAKAHITAYPGRLILPGFIDTHVHYPQTEMIAAFGEHLLEWLAKYTFPTELKFRDKVYARSVADLFLDLLLQNGTTRRKCSPRPLRNPSTPSLKRAVRATSAWSLALLALTAPVPRHQTISIPPTAFTLTART